MCYVYLLISSMQHWSPWDRCDKMGPDNYSTESLSWLVYEVPCKRSVEVQVMRLKGFLVEDTKREYTDLCLNSSFHPDSLNSVSILSFTKITIIKATSSYGSDHEMRPNSLSVKHTTCCFWLGVVAQDTNLLDLLLILIPKA